MHDGGREGSANNHAWKVVQGICRWRGLMHGGQVEGRALHVHVRHVGEGGGADLVRRGLDWGLGRGRGHHALG